MISLSRFGLFGYTHLNAFIAGLKTGKILFKFNSEFEFTSFTNLSYQKKYTVFRVRQSVGEFIIKS